LLKDFGVAVGAGGGHVGVGLDDNIDQAQVFHVAGHGGNKGSGLSSLTDVQVDFEFESFLGDIQEFFQFVFDDFFRRQVGQMAFHGYLFEQGHFYSGDDMFSYAVPGSLAYPVDMHRGDETDVVPVFMGIAPHSQDILILSILPDELNDPAIYLVKGHTAAIGAIEESEAFGIIQSVQWFA